MLNFPIFKRHKSKSQRTATHDNENIFNTKSSSSTGSAGGCCDDALLEELIAQCDNARRGQAVGCCETSDATAVQNDTFNYCSRLSMSLTSIVNDPNCLSYFVQFLEAQNALSLIKFYLDIENFKTAALTQLRKNTRATADTTESIESLNHLHKVGGEDHASKLVSHLNSNKETPTVTTLQEDEIDTTCGTVVHAVDQQLSGSRNSEGEHNSVPELKTLCDLSMRKPLTDDEKSQIFAETKQQITKYEYNKKRTGSELSLCSVRTQSTEVAAMNATISSASVKDAIAIYQKYLAPNAKDFLELPVMILSQVSLVLCSKRFGADDEYDNEGLKGISISGISDSFDVESQEHDGNCYENFQESVPISAHCFDEAQHYVLEQLEREHLNNFLQSVFYCKYCIELVEQVGDTQVDKEKLSIYDILCSEVTLFFFMEFLEQHGDRECLEFWTVAINFRKSCVSGSTDGNGSRYSRCSGGSYPSDELTETQLESQADAMIIYEKFFSLQSKQRLWCFSDRVRSHVEERICSDELVAYCFDLPLQIIAKYLERKYLKEFLKSQLFENYLNELKTKIHEELTIGIMPTTNSCGISSNNNNNQTHKLSLKRYKTQNQQQQRYHRKSMSDCTQDNFLKFISQQNTLLAMEGSNTRNATTTTTTTTTQYRNLNTNGANMNIDARQLTNPNLLWRRSTSTDETGSGGCGSSGGGLKFGRINSLGRYERDFEAFDAFSSGNKNNWSLSLGGNKIKNAMRKLVNLPEHKVQEEIAWQVAEMIVKDVTNITLSGSAPCVDNAAQGKHGLDKI